MAERFWADDFDMDLPKVLPNLDDILGDTADVRLWTYGHTSHGRLNNPAMWNSHEGFTAYFGLDNSGTWKPADHYTSSDEMVECTWREVVRDVWVHQCLVLVDYHRVWDTNPLNGVFQDLMCHRRGWRELPDGKVPELVARVADEVRQATERLRVVSGGCRG